MLASNYTVDGDNVTALLPPGTITQPQHRQQFYVSQQLTTGPHQLTITNLGMQFWIDYILLTMDDDPTLPSGVATESSPSPSTGRQTSIQTTPSTALSSSISSAAEKGIQTGGSTTRTSGEPSSTPATVLPNMSLITPSPSASSSDSGASAYNATRPPQRPPSSRLRGMIAGVAVGSVVLVALAAAIFRLWSRRRRPPVS